MSRTESIEDFYKARFNWVPDTLKKEIGHFNVFRIEDFVGRNARPVPFSRKDYYKVSLIIGRKMIQYADRTVVINKQALLFSNPQIPYRFEAMEELQSGYIAVFTPAFFHNFGNLKSYSVFQPNETHVFELSDEQTGPIAAIYERMLGEIRSDYAHKYDVLRNLVFEVLHSAMKMQPARDVGHPDTNASRRICILFLELLERQFPIEDTGQRFQLRSASDFARQLSIHVNHLNKALKETTGKTTSGIIAERVLQEAKILLRNTRWNVSEIAYTLGFNEVTHFNNFFKKKLDLSPTQFRNN
jgi:AraC family transcriptional activator of pobA